MAEGPRDPSVLTVARTLPRHVRGGMETVTWELVRALARQGVDQTVVTTAVDHEAKVLEADGIEVHEVAYVPDRLRDEPRYRWWPHFGRAAARYAREEGLEPDLVHCQSFYADGFLARPDPPPTVATLHGTAYHHDYLGGAREKLIREVGRFHPRRLLQWADVLRRTLDERRQLRGLDAIVAVSPIVVEMLHGVDADDPRVRVVPNGIDPEDWPPIDAEAARDELGWDDRDRVLYLGRMDRAKGIHHLLDVAAGIPDVDLVAAGGGPDLDWFRDAVERRGLADRVEVPGRVSDEARRQMYAAADLFCLPSLAEAFGMVLLESMIMGTPVAVRRRWLPDELLAHAVVEDDVVEAVRRGLEAPTPDPGTLRSAVVDGYGWDRIARRYLDLYRDLVPR